MKLVDEVAVRLPAWVRVVFALLAVPFAALSFWLAGMSGAGWVALAASSLSALTALVLLVTSATGRIPRWMWFVPWLIPPG
jgi:hypothetical protein